MRRYADVLWRVLFFMAGYWVGCLAGSLIVVFMMK